MNTSWISASVVFSAFLVYGCVKKVILTANGEAPPWWAFALFDFIVIVLLRLAMKSRYKV